ncbi:MAG: PP2C family protein-serine/threonine phosphatase [Acidimicrobiales bacterium]|jgi:serine phosphatase RsbU (regulator of sigma subunit)|nr:PP2C family protein-serine/threonine phosphatase [Acidimicrobiales bacterium]
MTTIILAALAVVSLAACGAYVQSARLRLRLVNLVDNDPSVDVEAHSLAFAAFRKEAHTAIVYGAIAIAAGIVAFVDVENISVIFGVLAIPGLASLWWARTSSREARMARNRYDIERRAGEALEQEQLAPKAWAARLAPEEVPDFSGFEIGRVYQAGSGLMAGDFFDVHRVSSTRVAAVIGDVAGHGIESSITAFQAKYLLRVFLRQFRDPAQAFEELNAQLAAGDRHEEFISAAVILFDTEAGTLRYASAGHPAIFLFQEDGTKPLRSTGPLLMLDPGAGYFSREVPMESGDLVVLYTDGLAEARAGGTLFGEERIIKTAERELNAPPDVLCKALLDAAKDHAGGVIDDDTAIMAIRRD